MEPHYKYFGTTRRDETTLANLPQKSLELVVFGDVLRWRGSYYSKVGTTILGVTVLVAHNGLNGVGPNLLLNQHGNLHVVTHLNDSHVRIVRVKKQHIEVKELVNVYTEVKVHHLGGRKEQNKARRKGIDYELIRAVVVDDVFDPEQVFLQGLDVFKLHLIGVLGIH